MQSRRFSDGFPFRVAPFLLTLPPPSFPLGQTQFPSTNAAGHRVLERESF